MFSKRQRASIQRGLFLAFKSDVVETPELLRILALPRRDWEKAGVFDEFSQTSLGIDELVELLTGALKQPMGVQRLWPVQAKALQDVHDIGGLFAPISVGGGKTLIVFVAPLLLDALRPLLVVPARLRGKTHREYQEYGHNWRLHPDVQVVSYEKLSREGGTQIIEERKPDLFIFDEAHRLKNKGAAVTRRIGHWLEQHPDTKVVALSGTCTQRSLRDFAHLIRWCLPAELCPLPQSTAELEIWAAAVDVIKPYEQRMQGNVGALQLFCNEEEKTAGRDGVRSAIRRRVQETPGVVAAQTRDVSASLNIVLTLIDDYNPDTLKLAQELLKGQKPDGEVITGRDLSSRWRLFRTLTSGFWYRWDPPPPKQWLKCRRAWKWAVNEVLDQFIPGLESEALVAKAVISHPESGREGWSKVVSIYREWLQVRDSYVPKVVPVWVDSRMIFAVQDWCQKHRGIIWVSEIALGQRLERDLGLPYYHELGLDRQGRPIEEALPTSGSIVASVGSNSEGRNLQVWSDNLIISPPPTGTTWEQILGRTHRPGQEADEVWFEVYFGCAVEWECWKQALQDAEYASRLEAPKKLTYATIDRMFELPRGNALWPAR